jgi:hypothetical protein
MLGRRALCLLVGLALFSVIHLTRWLLGTMALIVLLWFGISAPLSWIGAYFGAKHGVRALFKSDKVLILTVYSRQFRIPFVLTPSRDRFPLALSTYVPG